MLGDFDLPLSREWLAGQENLAHPFWLKRVINPLGLTRLSREALSFVPQQLFGTFI